MNFPLVAMFNNIHWYLPPLVISVSLVYSASRFENWHLIWTHAIRWAIYILLFLGSVYVALYLVSLDILPLWVWAVVIIGGFLAYRYVMRIFFAEPHEAEKTAAEGTTPSEPAASS